MGEKGERERWERERGGEREVGEGRGREGGEHTLTAICRSIMN